MIWETLLVAVAVLAGIGIVSGAMLKGWQGWLALKTQELARPAASGDTASPAAARIELADLKERIRKLEAIAAGVDL